jgi:hypothetical protein
MSIKMHFYLKFGYFLYRLMALKREIKTRTFVAMGRGARERKQLNNRFSSLFPK